MKDLKVAFAAIAAIVGAGFASGREIASFFTAQGKWCGVGIVLCCTVIGLLVGMLAKLGKRTGSTSLPQLFARVMDERCGEAVQVTYTLLLMVVCAAMCSAAGELGALAIADSLARPAGMACAVAMALVFAKSGGHLARSGWLAAVVMLVFYMALCLFARPAGASTAAQGGVVLSGALGALYACLNATLAAGVVCAASQQAESPARAGLYTGILLLVLLFPACVAIGRLGATDLALPSVALAGQLGVAGFYLSIAALFAASVSTLATGFFSLKEQLLLAGLPRAICMPIAVGGSLMLSVVGFAPIVDVGYPLLGFLCAMFLPALALFL